MSFTSIDAAIVGADAIGQRRDLRRFEVVDRDRNAFAAEAGNKLRRLFDRLGPIIVRPRRCIGAGAAASRADHRRTRLAQRGGNATAGAARRARHYGNTSGKCAFV
jgi:hypothetical protein